MRSNLTVIVNKWLPARVRKLKKMLIEVVHVYSITKVCSLAFLLTCTRKYLQLVAEREPKLSNTYAL